MKFAGNYESALGAVVKLTSAVLSCFRVCVHIDQRQPRNCGQEHAFGLLWEAVTHDDRKGMKSSAGGGFMVWAGCCFCQGFAATFYLGLRSLFIARRVRRASVVTGFFAFSDAPKRDDLARDS